MNLDPSHMIQQASARIAELVIKADHLNEPQMVMFLEYRGVFMVMERVDGIKCCGLFPESTSFHGALRLLEAT